MKFKYNNKEYELILLTLSGSHLYGNSTPESDYDYRGVYIESTESKISLEPNTDTITTKKDDFSFGDYLIELGLDIERTDDIIAYELSKFSKLAIDCNPNILDTLFANPTKAVYINDKGLELLENRHLFLSSKIKHTFSGYANSQLKRMKSHARMLGKYPDINRLVEALEISYERDDIDFRFIQENFGGLIAEKITEETPQENKILDNCMTYYDFRNWWWNTGNNGDYEYWQFNFDKYRTPQLIDYSHLYDLKHKKIDKLDYNDDYFNCTYEDYIINYASFRKFSNSMLAIYTDGNGIFSREGNLKANDPEHIGDFVCLCSIDQMNYKSDCDEIRKLWEWKAKRNEARSELEKLYSFDTKHGSHLLRLLYKCNEILSTGDYNPKMYGIIYDMVTDCRTGKLTYDEVLTIAESLEEESNELYKTTKLLKKANFKAINKLIVELYLKD